MLTGSRRAQRRVHSEPHPRTVRCSLNAEAARLVVRHQKFLQVEVSPPPSSTTRPSRLLRNLPLTHTTLLLKSKETGKGRRGGRRKGLQTRTDRREVWCCPWCSSSYSDLTCCSPPRVSIPHSLWGFVTEDPLFFIALIDHHRRNSGTWSVLLSYRHPSD
jgi:hypothetical protein